MTTTRTSDKPTSEPPKDAITPTIAKVDKKPNKLFKAWRTSTLLIIVVLGVRFIYLIVVVFSYATPILYQMTRNLVSRPWRSIKYPEGTKFFYPPHPYKLVDRNKSTHADGYFMFCVITTSACYLGELGECLEVAYGIFYVQRKNLRNSRKRCRNYAIIIVVALVIYFIAVISFFISAEFLFAYWIDFVTIPLLVYLMVKRMKLIELLIDDGMDTTLDLISVDSEKQLLPDSTEPKKTAASEANIKADPDYQTLFGNKKDKNESLAGGSFGSGSGSVGGGKSPLERDSIAAELTPVETSEVPSSVHSSVAPTDETDEEAHRDSNPAKKGKVNKKKGKKLKSDDDQGEHRDSNQSSNKSSNKGESIKSKKKGVKKKS